MSKSTLKNRVKFGSLKHAQFNAHRVQFEYSVSGRKNRRSDLVIFEISPRWFKVEKMFNMNLFRTCNSFLVTYHLSHSEKLLKFSFEKFRLI